MSTPLPERASLEHLKNEAKALLKSAKSGDVEAVKQLGEPRLANAQLAIAREYGFPSWAKLKRHVEGFETRREEFFARIQAGDRARVSALLDEDPRLARSHNPQNFGQTPISAAATREDRQMIDLLLERGADINAKSDWWAGNFGVLDYGSDEISDFLLKRGATLTAHAAARLGMAKELKDILAKNPESVRERGGDGQYPLHFSKTPEIVDILVDAGADLDARDVDHEATAAQWRIKNEPVLRRLVERGASTEIFLAVALDDPELIEKHLNHDPEALTRKTTDSGNPMIHDKAPGAPIYIYEIGTVRPLQLAANLGRRRAYDYLFAKSPPHIQLLASTWSGDTEKAHALKGHIKDLSKQDAAQIADASRYKHLDQLKLMLEVGFDVNAQDHEGMAPIHWTGFHGWLEGMELVLKYKPSLTLKNGYGGTALGTLCFGSQHGWYREGAFAECAELLIAAGSEVPVTDSGTAEVKAVLAKHR